MQEGSSVTMPAQQGQALPHRLEDPQVDCVEAERRFLDGIEDLGKHKHVC